MTSLKEFVFLKKDRESDEETESSGPSAKSHWQKSETNRQLIREV
jgi:hypothetical protein